LPGLERDDATAHPAPQRIRAAEPCPRAVWSPAQQFTAFASSSQPLRIAQPPDIFGAKIESRHAMETPMKKERLLAFSDGVIAIIITIMVLEMKVPHGTEWADLARLVPVFLSYVLSFIYIAIYWNNHHHLMHTCSRVNGTILWANMHLLFWLSLIPFATGWMGENHFQPLPTAIYGFALVMPAVAYFILQSAIVRIQGAHSPLAKALGSDIKGKISPFIYLAAIPLAFYNPWVSCALYVAVALVWIIPDRRIANAVDQFEE
jgi:uncharacterized membrane protein